jgi:predicted RNA-binding protein YlqC (UPF0109 family)
MSNQFSYRQLLHRIVDGLVYKPNLVNVREVRADRRVDLFVKIHTDDVGLLVGKSGKNVQALQELFRNIGTTHGDTVGISAQGEGTQTDGPRVYYADRSWDKTPMLIAIFDECVKAMGFTIEVKAEEFHDKTLLSVHSPIPKEKMRPLDWVLKMVACHSGRKLVIDWE